VLCSNQAALLPHLDLLMMNVDIAALPTPDCISSLFIKHTSNAQKKGPVILTRFVKLLVKVGDLFGQLFGLLG
jgi:hypothetical protein